MKDKCTKYEALFTFSDEKTLMEHIANCPDCKAEHEKMLKVSELLQEVKPYYLKKRKDSFIRLKVACVLCVGLFAGMAIGYFNQYTNYQYSAYVDSYDTTNEYGMPIDSYGLIDIN